MTIYRLTHEITFPDPREAESDGLLAVGGDLRPERLLLAYALGIFPWYSRPPILWFSPDPRSVLPLRAVRIHRSLRKVMRKHRFEIRADTAFAELIFRCSTIKRVGQSGTWITSEMREAYVRLHELGFAHSIEAWRNGELVGGLYGVSLGAAFFGESMFSLEANASKVALVTLLSVLRERAFHFLDCQVPSPHLNQLGALSWSREVFLTALAHALALPTAQGTWTDWFLCAPSLPKDWSYKDESGE